MNSSIRKSILALALDLSLIGCASGNLHSHAYEPTVPVATKLTSRETQNLTPSRGPAVAPILFHDIDISAIVNFAGEHTFRLTKPIVLYNWTHRADLQKADSFNPQRSLEFAQSFARVYWQAQYQDRNNHYNFGSGFYLATDPVTSRGYASGGPEGRLADDWLLTQITLPVGLKIFDWHNYQEDQSSPESQLITQTLLKLGCSAERIYAKGGFSELLMAPKYDSKTLCIDAMSEIFRKINPIQVFAYDFGATAFDACKTGNSELDEWHREAFVVTDDSWLRADLVRNFNRLSKGDLENRQLIQSMFVEETALRVKSTPQGVPINSFTEQLWTDVKFESIQPTTNEYMQKNFFACQSPAPYTPSPSR